MKEAFRSFLIGIAGLGTVRVTGNWKNQKPREVVALRGAITKDQFNEAVATLNNEDRGVQLTLKQGATQSEIEKARAMYTQLAEAFGSGVGESLYNGRTQFRLASSPVSVDDAILNW